MSCKWVIYSYTNIIRLTSITQANFTKDDDNFIDKKFFPKRKILKIFACFDLSKA